MYPVKNHVQEFTYKGLEKNYMCFQFSNVICKLNLNIKVCKLYVVSQYEVAKEYI